MPFFAFVALPPDQIGGIAVLGLELAVAYPLTTNRVMGICGFAPERQEAGVATRRDPKAVVQDFYKQMRAIGASHLDQIYAAMGSEARGFDVRMDRENAGSNDLEVAVLQGDDDDDVGIEGELPVEPERDPLIGLFQSRRYRMSIDDCVWDVRIRPSVTACVLERADGLSKMWWTFEGVPDIAASPQDEKGAVRFLDVTTELASLALPRLRDAYTQTLAAITGKSRGPHRLSNHQLRVSLADNTDRSFSHLVDAMNLDGMSFAQAAAGKAGSDVREGANEVMSFVSKSNKQPANPDSIKVSAVARGLAAVYTSSVKDLRWTEAAPKMAVSGLASAVGMISAGAQIDPAWTRRTTTPDLLRALSAARPLSKSLAQAGARQLERQLRDNPIL